MRFLLKEFFWFFVYAFVWSMCCVFIFVWFLFTNPILTSALTNKKITYAHQKLKFINHTQLQYETHLLKINGNGFHMDIRTVILHVDLMYFFLPEHPFISYVKFEKPNIQIAPPELNNKKNGSVSYFLSNANVKFVKAVLIHFMQTKTFVIQNGLILYHSPHFHINMKNINIIIDKPRNQYLIQVSSTIGIILNKKKSIINWTIHSYYNHKKDQNINHRNLHIIPVIVHVQLQNMYQPLPIPLLLYIDNALNPIKIIVRQPQFQAQLLFINHHWTNIKFISTYKNLDISEQSIGSLDGIINGTITGIINPLSQKIQGSLSLNGEMMYKNSHYISNPMQLNFTYVNYLLDQSFKLNFFGTLQNISHKQYVKGKIVWNKNVLHNILTIHSVTKNIPYPMVIDFFPDIPNTLKVKQWLQQHMLQSKTDVDFTYTQNLNSQHKPSVNTLLNVKNAILTKYAQGLPPMYIQQGSVQITESDTKIYLIKANIKHVTLHGSTMKIIYFNPNFQFVFYYKTNLLHALSILEKKPIHLMFPKFLTIPIHTQQLTGLFTGITYLNLNKNTKKITQNTKAFIKNMNWNLQPTINSLLHIKDMQAFPLKSNTITIISDDNSSKITIPKIVNPGITGNFTLQYYNKTKMFSMNLQSVINMDKTPYIKALAPSIAGKAYFNLTSQFHAYTFPIFHISIQSLKDDPLYLANTSIIIPSDMVVKGTLKNHVRLLRLSKSHKNKWQLSFNVLQKLPTKTITPIMGNLQFKQNGNIQSLFISKFTLYGNNATLLYKPQTLLSMKGSLVVSVNMIQKYYASLTPKKNKSMGSKKKNKSPSYYWVPNVHINLSHLIVSSPSFRNSLQFHYNYTNNHFIQLKIEGLWNKKPISLNIRKNKMKANIPQIANILKDFHITSNYSKGNMSIETPKEGHFLMKIQNLTMNNASIFIKILNLSNPRNIININKQKKLVIEKITIPYVLKENRLIIGNARFTTKGNAIGITFNGYYDFFSKNVKGSGVIIPFYSLDNFLGKIPIIQLLINENNSVIGANYSISGPLQNPKISINALSTLTPGVIRNIW